MTTANKLLTRAEIAEQLGVSLSKAGQLMKEQPVIVRCQNCKHWDKGHAEDCHNIRSVCFGNGYCPPEWFCPVGERGDPD